ncbi:ABC transporter ATP-binding protein [Candidatus Sumerlaeota bacterium]|nr:ABC transporter ATP-binding protein [Candidatus Sumerlaeota bacterium]
MIKTYGLTKRYNDLTAVDGLDLEINEGDIFGFIGPNGAGKTTTIKMLATLIRPTDGYAEVCGYNVIQNVDDVKRVIGYMPDFFGVYDDMKVWEYLDFFAMAYKIDPSRRHKIVDDVLELTDLMGKKQDYVEALSRGMKQRLCLAKTLVHDPKVLLLDEPASGLDPRARIEIRELLQELRRMGKTILISSHILTELADFCNTIGIIEQGKLLVSGPVEEIMQKLHGARVLEVRVRTDFDKASNILLRNEGVQKVETEGEVLRVYVDVDLEDTSGLMEALVHEGIRVSSFRELEVDLEDIFMRITKGAVQ